MSTPIGFVSRCRLHFSLIILSLAPAGPGTAFGQAGAIDPSFAPGPAFLPISRLALQSDGKVILAGTFTSFGGTTVSNLARLKTDGTLDPGFDAGTGLTGTTSVIPGVLTNVQPPVVNAVAVQADDRILLGGGFDVVNGTGRTNLARLMANGALDASFDPRPDNTVASFLPLADGRIFVGGAFTKIGGAARKNLALLNSDGSADGSFNPNWGALISSTVLGIARQSDGKLVVVGSIGKLVGFTLSSIGVARFNADGSLDGSFAGPALGAVVNRLSSVAVQTDGKIIVTGLFGTIGGVAHQGIARLTDTGGVDPAWTGAGIGTSLGLLQAMRLQPDGKVLIGGTFTTYNGTPRPALARVNTDGSLDTTFAAPDWSAGSSVATMALQTDGKVIVGGGFSSASSLASLLRLNGDSSSSATAPVITTHPADQLVPAGGTATFTVTATSETTPTYEWRHSGTNLPGATAATLTIENVDQEDGGVYDVVVTNTGGSVTSQGALLNPVSPGWPDLSFKNGGTNPIRVNSLFRQSDGKILVGGAFSKMDGYTRNLVARLNADGTVDQAFDPSKTATVEIHGVAAQSSGKAIVVGSLIWPNDGVAYGGVGRLNLNGSLDKAFNPGSGPDDQVFAVAVQSDDKVFIGGFFGHVNGATRNGVARLNADGELDNGFVSTLPAVRVISAIAVQPTDGKIIVGGQSGGSIAIPRKNIARLLPSGTVDDTFRPGTGPDAQVRSIALQGDGKIVIGGEFTSVNGVPRNGVARLNPDGTLDATFDTSPVPPIGAFIWSVAVQPDGKVLAAGAFNAYGGILRRNIVRLNTTGGVDLSFDPGLGAQDIEVKALLVLPDGKIYAGGDFTLYNGVSFNRLVRLHGGGPSGDGATVQFTVGQGSLTFTWPAGFTLQSSARLVPANWTDAPGDSPQTFATGLGQGFFRLIKR